ncbi:ESPR-type extended signal peptide-containing protein, partial [Acinetobacter sp. Ac_5812]|uniref:ESPR-type extended signal peptide-containing protein n=1 Tax=Acinetobacter sp. Ac_5812 TaxID=1848937 RepID=UPI0025AFAC43
MNHIFKKIWNKSLGRMVVVSENARSAGKTDNTTGVLVSSDAVTARSISYRGFSLQTLVLSIALVTGSNVWAEVCDVNGSGGSGGSTALSGTFVCGLNNTISSLLGGSLAIGSDNFVSGTGFNSALGSYNTVSSEGAVSVGFLNSSIGLGSTAIGTATNALNPQHHRLLVDNIQNGVLVSVNDIAVTATGASRSTITHINGQAVSTAERDRFLTNLQIGGNIAVGRFSSAVGVKNLTLGESSAAVGFNNNATKLNSSVFGTNSQAIADGATAIGNNSLANEANTVSVGRSGAEKRITNVAAGTQGTDAVNLGQVQSLFSAIGVSDNYAHNSNDTALGSTSGVAHATENNGTTLTKVAEISVTSTSTSLDDIDSFTINGITTTKAAAPDKVAAFIQAAKKGGNIAVGTNSSAVGVANIVTSASSTAIGYSNEARGNASVAVGYNNTALMHASSAIGHDNVALHDYGTSIGVNNYSQNKSSVAVGSNISSLRPTSITTNGLGIITEINGIPVTATGNTTATITHVNGTAVTATERQAFLERLQWGGNLALAENSSVLGVGGITLGANSTAVGYGNTARGANSSALGYLNTSVGQSSTAVGSATSPAGRTPPGVIVTAGVVDAIDGVTVVSTATSWTDLRDNPTKLTSVNGMVLSEEQKSAYVNALRYGSNAAIGSASNAMGNENIALGLNSNALGSNNKAIASTTNALGRTNLASGEYSSAVGHANTSSGVDSNALGSYNVASASGSSAVGRQNTASGQFSSAVGYQNIANGMRSVAVGSKNLAQQLGATAIGASSAFGTVNYKNDGTKITYINDIPVTATGLTVSTITAVNGVSVTQSQVTDLINALQAGANVAWGVQSTAVGSQNIAVDQQSSAVGSKNSAIGYTSSAIGNNNVALKDNSNAIGADNRAVLANSNAVGTRNIAAQANSNAIGTRNTALGSSSTAMGSAIRNSAVNPTVGYTAGVVSSINGVRVTSTATSWLDLTNNPSKLTAINNLTLTSEQSTAFVTNVGYGGNIAFGTESNAIGNQNYSIGAQSNAIGVANIALGSSSSAVGVSNKAKGNLSFAAGSNNLSQQTGSTTVGASTGFTYAFYSNDGTKLTAINGIPVTALDLSTASITHINGLAVSQQDVQDFLKSIENGGSIAFGTNSTSVGNQNIAAGNHSTTVGARNVAGDIATAVGHNNTATGVASTAVGQANKALGGNSTSVGYDNEATGVFSNALGFDNQAAHQNTSAVGAANKALGINSNAVGYLNTAQSVDSSAFGSQNSVTGVRGSAFGYKNEASGLDSSALGHENKAQAMDSAALGTDNLASGMGSSAVGNANKALGFKSSAFGSNNLASGQSSHAFGNDNSAVGKSSSAVGVGGAALGNASSVMGGALEDQSSFDPTQPLTVLSGRILEIDSSTMTGKIDGLDFSFDPNNPTHPVTLGGKAFTIEEMNALMQAVEKGGAIAVGQQALAAGSRSTAFGDKATAIGAESKAYADNSVALGAGSVADEANTVSVGKAGAEKRITNIADAQNDYDAVNKKVLTAAVADAVFYDTGSSKELITLTGATGTKITNLKDATLDVNSTDAVTGKQLYATNNSVDNLDSRVTTEVGTLNTRIDGVDTTIAG